MILRKSIQFFIAIAAIAWWVGSLFLQTSNIYPYNNLLLSYSSLSLMALIVLLVVHDLIVFRSAKQVLDFLPATKRRAPSLEELGSAKLWRSLPKWIIACTTLWILMTYAMLSSFTFPHMNEVITEYIKKDKKSSNKIGVIKGFGFYKGGTSFTSQDSSHFDLTIRVYGSNGNFPLKISIDKKHESYQIKSLHILR